MNPTSKRGSRLEIPFTKIENNFIKKDKIIEIIQDLLSYLPDASVNGKSRYRYAWDECFGDEQDMVKEVREKYRKIIETLK